MGQGESKQLAAGEDVKALLASKSVLMPKETEGNMTFTQQLIQALGTNNTELILQAVDAYNQKFDANNSRRIKMEPYANNIKSFHTRLVDSIDGARKLEGLNDDERIKAWGDIPELKDATRTFNTMKKYITKEVDVLKQSVVTDSVVANNQDIKGTIVQIFDRFSDLKTRNMFFEYKYIQMYLFLSVFVQHVYNTMDKFITDVISINGLKDKYRQDAYKQIFEKLLAMYNVRGDSLNLDIENTDQFFNELAQGMDKKMEDIKKSYDAAAKSSMDDILRFILENENTMTKSLMQLVKEKNSGVTPSASAAPAATPVRTTPPQASRIEASGANPLMSGPPAPPIQPVQLPASQAARTAATGGVPESVSLNDIIAASSLPPKSGGFIRGLSTMPQAFYDLS